FNRSYAHESGRVYHERIDMNPVEQIKLARRDFLTSSASGVGGLALASLLQHELMASDAAAVNPLAPKAPHFAAKAKNCIFVFLAGAPSQLDLFDDKPKLRELHGQPLPKSMTENV